MGGRGTPGRGRVRLTQRSVFAVVATPRSRSTADGRGAGHRLCPYSPLAKSFLTRKIDEPTTFDTADLRTAIPRFTPEARSASQALVDLLGSIAARKHASPAQIQVQGARYPEHLQRLIDR